MGQGACGLGKVGCWPTPWLLWLRVFGAVVILALLLALSPFDSGHCPPAPRRWLLSGATPVHSDPLMWHPADSVESVAMHFIHTLFAVPQVCLCPAFVSMTLVYLCASKMKSP